MKDLSYLTDRYDEKIQKVLSIGAPLNFIFYTDPHNGLSRHDCPKHPDYAPTDYESAVDALNSMRYILDRVKIDCLVCGGDIGNDYAKTGEKAHETFREIMEAMYALPVPVHNCIGNHDDCVCTRILEPEDKSPVETYILTKEQLHALCMKNNPTEENYYYVDFDEQGYRFVFMNTSDFPYGIDEAGNLNHPINKVAVSDKQLAWLRETVSSTKNRVIVFSHAPLSCRGMFGAGDPEGGPEAVQILQEADNAVAMFSGHIHLDFVTYEGHLANISVQAATALTHGQWGATAPWRDFGAYTEVCFDVVSVKGDSIYLTRFGAGDDRMATVIRGRYYSK